MENMHAAGHQHTMDASMQHSTTFHLVGGHGNIPGHNHGEGISGHAHHAMMLQDFKHRFYISLLLTLPILLLSPMIQNLLGFSLSIPAGKYILFAFATVLFIYGGKPFLTDAVGELKQKSPAMMTLIAFAISISYLYSTLTVFFITGTAFF